MPAESVRVVLLVDDNAAVRTLVRKLFSVEDDFEVAGEAENGREAVQKASELKPDVIVLDLAMPEMNGLDAAVELRKLLPQVKIILFTVEEGHEVERLAREAGVHAMISKHSAPELVAKARELLGQDDDQLENAS